MDWFGVNYDNYLSVFRDFFCGCPFCSIHRMFACKKNSWHWPHWSTFPHTNKKKHVTCTSNKILIIKHYDNNSNNHRKKSSTIIWDFNKVPRVQLKRFLILKKWQKLLGDYNRNLSMPTLWLNHQLIACILPVEYVPIGTV